MKIDKFHFAMIIATLVVVTALVTFILTRRTCGDNVVSEVTPHVLSEHELQM